MAPTKWWVDQNSRLQQPVIPPDNKQTNKQTIADKIITPLVLIVVVITYIQILATISTRMRLKLQHHFSPIKNELLVM